MSQTTVTLIRHLSGFLAALETLVNELKPQLEQLKQEHEKTKQS
jgi:hypothetical protein